VLQATQVWLPSVLHTSLPLQSPSTLHSTHELVATSHTEVAPLQALTAALHTSHVPVTQAGVALRCVQSPSPAHASHMWVDGLQAAALALGQSASVRHATQAWASQKAPPAWPMQSVLMLHSWQVLLVPSHTSIAPHALASLAVHSAHTPGEAQAGVAPEHALPPPGTQMTQAFVDVSQAAKAPPLAVLHSVSLVHAAHICVLPSQWGADDVQSVAATQPTQVWVDASHAGVVPPQSACSRQGTQWPLPMSQRGVSPKLAQSVSAVHAAQVPPSHTGAEAVQSVAPVQPSHTCVEVLHTLAPAQSSSPRHATHSCAVVSQRPVVQSPSPTQPTQACAVTSHTGAVESVQAGVQSMDASLASVVASSEASPASTDASAMATQRPSTGACPGGQVAPPQAVSATAASSTTRAVRRTSCAPSGAGRRLPMSIVAESTLGFCAEQRSGLRTLGSEPGSCPPVQDGPGS